VSFARPELLPFVALLPAGLAIAIWIFARRRTRIAEALGGAALLGRLGAADLARFPTARAVLIVTAGAALALAAAGPRWGERTVVRESQSLNLVLALDVSRSMLVRDAAPDRLERMRLLVRRVVRDLPGDRIGLVVFAGRAYVLAPMTSDHSALDLYIDALDPEIVSQGGTAVALGIQQATDLVRARPELGGDRVVLLISDGEAHEERTEVMAAVERARRAGVVVNTVGVGTAAGGNVPIYGDDGSTVLGYARNELGEIHVSRLDEPLLREAASRGGGSYVHLDGPAATAQVIASLRGLDRDRGSETRTEPADRYALFLGLALLLLVLDAALAAGIRVSLPQRLAPVARAATVAALVLLLTGFGIGDVERGNRHYRAGRFAEAVEAYRSALRSGDGDATIHYNLATALLQLREWGEAEHHFHRALESVEPALRQDAYYNLGNRFLYQARLNSGETSLQLLESAADAYRHALRLDPGDGQAKWNLEMTLREIEEQSQQMPPQGEGGPQDPDQGGQDGDEPQPDPGQGTGAAGQQGAGQQQRMHGDPDGRPLTQQEADRILNAAEQDERQLTRDRLTRGQRTTPVGRDW
jgi:Ca-activated chloride channel homolog